MRGETKVIKALNEVTATTTSAPIDIKGAERVTIICKRTNHSAGTAIFTGEVGAGTDYATYNKFISNATNTNVQGLTRVANITHSGNAVGIMSLSPEDALEFIKITVTSTTNGGKDSAIVIVDYK
jgi:hypothetical protein